MECQSIEIALALLGYLLPAVIDYATTPSDPNADWDCHAYEVCIDRNSVQTDSHVIHVTIRNGINPRFADIDCKTRLIRVVDPGTGDTRVVSFLMNPFAISMCSKARR